MIGLELLITKNSNSTLYPFSSGEATAVTRDVLTLGSKLSIVSCISLSIRDAVTESKLSNNSLRILLPISGWMVFRNDSLKQDF